MKVGHVFVGTQCVAPIKSTSGRKDRNVRVLWVSNDGFVADVETTKGHPKKETFAVSRLKRKQ